MKPKVNVVKEAPKFINPIIQSGFKSVASVQSWAEHHRYSVVYYIEKKQRVYVDRAAVMLNEARQLERDAKRILRDAQELADLAEAS